MMWLHRFFYCAAVILCFVFASPAHAAAPAAAKDRKVAKNAAQKSSRVQEHKKQTASVDDRAIWLKRAESAEVFSGKASLYSRGLHGGATASGVAYDMYTFTAAHRTLPIGTIVKVTDQDNGRSVMVCITDRGPYVHGRIIDLSWAAARQLDLNKRGVGKVNLEVVGDENGTPFRSDEAWYVQYSAKSNEHVGPFRAFADAAAMHEALSQVHPEAEVVIDNAR
ncbi:MAG: septal ring lytic transglycosylase RlpA family protein [Desulfovibrio sp.]|jgi:rare lipoprotein A (peptidoglycan hydrolase)|nr:septal ring lytic transglycosylase RlpA family protein [Desulfovibrio sp.]